MDTAAPPLLLTPPPLAWDDDGVPTATDFGDVYFSRGGGVAETEYVFLGHNRLAERWAALAAGAPGTFVIGETGFGTGLNFLCAARLWLATAPSSWRLHFVSAERYPLTAAQLTRAAVHWPELAELAAELHAAWPPPLRGFHSRELADGRIRLQLLFGDANEQLPQLEDSAAATLPSGFAVDAWFLDGFAPARNPDLWSESLFATIGRLSRAGTTLATFTAAGVVRRGMTAAGFAMTRVPGYGSKREMLAGTCFGRLERAPAHAAVAPTDPSRVDPSRSDPRRDARQPLGDERRQSAIPAVRVTAVDYWAWPPPARRRQPVIVVGGGLAGTSTARALAERGFPVTLLEAAPLLAAGASGNPLGVLYTKLSAHESAVARFALTSWLHAIAWYRRGIVEGRWPADAANFCGMLQLMDDDHQLEQLQAAFSNADCSHTDWATTDSTDTDWLRFVDAAAASDLAGCRVRQPGIWLPQAGWLAPAAICAGNAGHPLIDVRLETQVASLTRAGDCWHLATSQGDFTAGIVVVAAAQQAVQLLPAAALPLRSIRGQISLLPAADIANAPRAVICHDGYASTLPNGDLCIGATFDLRDADPALRADSHAQNLVALQAALPDVLKSAPDPAALPGRVSFRCTSPDYLPLVGPLPDPAPTRERYAELRQRSRAVIAAEPAWLPGLFVNVGHGSRGLSSTPLSAELLAALIAGEPRPLPRSLVQALNPARFLLRELIRGTR